MPRKTSPVVEFVLDNSLADKLLQLKLSGPESGKVRGARFEACLEMWIRFAFSRQIRLS